ncbi:MAG: 2-C-methyl-D-erythritol 4-phosphate cytidylyltransferase [Eubacteriales bacterium]|nr:2-C-methyl-D-erythritol 4-phosphate cytidylyltransferase [Eubacteriales bacterium]
MKDKSTAIVLSAGRGKRMKTAVSKQYLLIKGKPVIYYSLKAFQECPFIDEVILVAGEEDIAFCRTEIVEKYNLTKVTQIISGGAERYDSVWCGLKAVQDSAYVYIHDGARPFLDQPILERARTAVEEAGACVVGMPAKDTIKISDPEGFAKCTPPRAFVWQIQTPQVFRYELVYGAYQKLMEALDRGETLTVTDDAMAVESMTEHRVRLVEGSYANIKITTPEDLKIAELLLG